VRTVVEIIKRHFISGVLVVVPFILTFIVLRFLFEAIDGILEPYLHNLLGYYRTGLGLLTTLLIILLAGIVTRSLLGHRLYRIGERIMGRMPLIRPIYSASKQLLEGLTNADKSSFKEVALIQYPRRGLFTLCFVSSRLTIEVDGVQVQHATCFVPSTPTPVSGMVVLVPSSEVRSVNMSVEDGIKFLVSGGVASPHLIKAQEKLETRTKEGNFDEAG